MSVENIYVTDFAHFPTGYMEANMECLCVRAILSLEKIEIRLFYISNIIVSSMMKLQRSLCHIDHCSQVICLCHASMYLAM